MGRTEPRESSLHTAGDAEMVINTTARDQSVQRPSVHRTTPRIVVESADRT